MKGASRNPGKRRARKHSAPFTGAERARLLGLQNDAIRYFIENQLPNGLVLDRQHNFGRRNMHGLCSTSATGMGLIAIALAADPQHRLISHDEAVRRVRKALSTAFTLTQVQGIMPHFVDSRTLQPVGSDRLSTIDSAWLIAGGLWAAEYLHDGAARQLARALYRRVDWRFWADGGLLIHHGMDDQGKMLPACWDRLNAETAFLYALAIGADNGKALPAHSWQALKPYFGRVQGIKFASADLGLFVFQYSLELLDGDKLPPTAGVLLTREAPKAVRANYLACRALRRKFRTYRYFWGLSAGDGPGDRPGAPDAYRAYSPEDADGTAHITATLASIGVCPRLVLRNIARAESGVLPRIRGRYGYSNVNLDRAFVSRDVVGIDLGAAVMGIENALFGGRVRRTSHRLPQVKRAVRRLHNFHG